ncbi:MAG TPA: hypothetical protein VD886_15435, partial [Herpetosiphonaceae bacterium]|nr:hypothetical protein [Herpetosiphonaceae bacterium]
MINEPLTSNDAPMQFNGPWTREARERAVADEVKQAYIEYFRKAVKIRNWIPWDDLPLKEMEQYGHLLSDDTVTLIESFLGVEDYVGDYVLDGLNIVHGRRE